MPDHRLDATLCEFTAAQHFACFQRELGSLGVSHQRYTLRGLQGGGATDHWLQYRGLPQLRRRGRWTSERTLEKYIQERDLSTSSEPALQRSCRPSQCSRRARASLPRRTSPRRIPPPTPAATTLTRKGQRSSLRSAQRRRATELCPTPPCLSEQYLHYFVTWHTVRAQSHLDVSCRVTQTAVAPWSCFSFFFVILSNEMKHRNVCQIQHLNMNSKHEAIQHANKKKQSQMTKLQHFAKKKTLSLLTWLSFFQ